MFIEVALLATHQLFYIPVRGGEYPAVSRLVLLATEDQNPVLARTMRNNRIQYTFLPSFIEWKKFSCLRFPTHFVGKGYFPYIVSSANIPAGERGIPEAVLFSLLGKKGLFPRIVRYDDGKSPFFLKEEDVGILLK